MGKCFTLSCTEYSLDEQGKEACKTDISNGEAFTNKEMLITKVIVHNLQALFQISHFLFESCISHSFLSPDAFDH
jgi:hypothetical protein